MKTKLFEALLVERRAQRPVAVVTRIADGAQALVGSMGVVGELALAAPLLDEVGQLLRAGRSAMLRDGENDVFVRSHVSQPRLVIVGAVHIAQALAPMAATAGFEVVVVDPRRAFATEKRVPGVRMVHDWPDEALRALGLDPRTAVVTLSHDAKLDDPALIAALASDAFYIGALGSTRTHAKRVERLTAAGLGDRLGRIHAPIGLDLGGRAPAEIAVSILAQILLCRYRGEAASDPTRPPRQEAQKASTQ